ncbi:MAG: SEC-C domain-containing protein, partial [Desulfobulbaceae bacterium]|nr:SEC-C domain-containing protein [Desulfobulbaceae bacterium]
MTENRPCPCQSGKTFTSCCSPYLSEEKTAPTPEAMVRSRYSAYSEKDVKYLLKTWYPPSRPADIDPEEIPEWHELNIISSKYGGESDNLAIVEFKVSSLSQNKKYTFLETSSFIKEDGNWLYVDSDIAEELPSAHHQKTGRNDPCPCG